MGRGGGLDELSKLQVLKPKNKNNNNLIDTNQIKVHKNPFGMLNKHNKAAMITNHFKIHIRN